MRKVAAAGDVKRPRMCNPLIPKEKGPPREQAAGTIVRVSP